MSNLKRPRDPNQKAKLIVDIATGEKEDVDPDEGKEHAAVALGRKDVKKGGKTPPKVLHRKEERR
jgi:hypothetical protein